jgi:ATP-dependent Lon protease
VRPTSVAALESALASEEKLVALFTQRDPQNQKPGVDDLYPVGTKAVIKRMMRSDETIDVILQCVECIKLIELD